MSKRRSPRVLVVDDEAELREMLVDALSETGMEVCAAGSGKEAIDLGGRWPIDLVVADLILGDCNGLDVVAQLRATHNRDLPVVVITGKGDTRMLAEASRIRPVELMTKPLDIQHLRETVRSELARQADTRTLANRQSRIRRLVRRANIERKDLHRRLQASQADMDTASKQNSERMACQRALIDYQQQLLRAKNDDDVFKELFRTFVRRTGGLFGAALVCNAQGELHLAGRFGVPRPDSTNFCRHLGAPIVNMALADPRVMVLDAEEQRDAFDPAIRRYLTGVTLLTIPLVPAPGELIGLVVLYRKGEQPFLDEDIVLAELIGPPTAVAVERND